MILFFFGIQRGRKHAPTWPIFNILITKIKGELLWNYFIGAMKKKYS
jgi:hypothetical protein